MYALYKKIYRRRAQGTGIITKEVSNELLIKAVVKLTNLINTAVNIQYYNTYVSFE